MRIYMRRSENKENKYYMKISYNDIFLGKHQMKIKQEAQMSHRLPEEQ